MVGGSLGVCDGVDGSVKLDGVTIESVGVWVGAV